jgi:phospholipase C
MHRRRFLTTGAAALGAAATVGAVPAAAGALRRTNGVTPRRIDASECPITNIVVLMMENRSFDHMLGRLPGADGLRRDMWNPDEDGERVYVHRMRDMTCTLGDPHHHRSAALDQHNGGANDGFVLDSGTQTMGYYGEQELPWMYAVASEFTAFDHWFAGILGPTWPNRSYFHAGTSGGRTSNVFSPGNIGLNERTVWHQLRDAGIPWKIYFSDLPFTALHPELTLRYFDRFRIMQEFYGDAAAGTLPPVSMIEPGYFIGTDDHPPIDAQAGQRFMADVVHALMMSPQWPSTALIITYDENGGFYDHMPPPSLPDDHPEIADAVGFRVPSLLISPWARRGVAKRVHDHTSALKFIQWRFGLPPLSTRNATTNDILYAFDFSAPRLDLPDLPRPPIDNGLTALCLAGKFIGPKDPINYPGGGGMESATAWGEAELSPAARALTNAASRADAADDIPDADAPTPGPRAGALPFQEEIRIAGQPELAEVADAGLIPRELDVRPTADRPTPTPYLRPGGVPDRPAWRRPAPRTATRRPGAPEPRPAPAVVGRAKPNGAVERF